VRVAALAERQSAPPVPRPVSFFEFWPDWAFYGPIVAHWLLLGLRHRSFSLPTAANPGIELGGLCGESKTAILDLVADEQRPLLAPYVRLSRPDPGAAARAMAEAGLGFPLIAKPDIGMNGAGVRLVRDEAALPAYLAAFPPEAAVVLQRFVPGPGEAGLFYVRRPGEAQGRISSVTLKEAPKVVGDGRRTLRELVLADPRARLVPQFYLPRLGARQQSVPAAGEAVPLLLVGNHCKGSIFHDGAEHATPALTARIEALARAVPDFHFGRIDVRFTSLADLRRGEGLTVIEINGVGSEATHIWDARMRLGPAWAAQFEHYGAAFAIGAAMRTRGHRPAGLRAMWRAWRRQKALMARYPAHD
jgi:hypothetical protein